MAWSPLTWVDGVTKALAARFNNIEEGIKEALTAATKPGAGVNGSVTVGTVGRSRKIVAVIVGDNVTTKFKVPHRQNTYSVEVTYQTSSGGNPSELTTVAKTVAINANEIETTFSTPPGAGVIFWVSICC